MNYFKILIISFCFTILTHAGSYFEEGADYFHDNRYEQAFNSFVEAIFDPDDDIKIWLEQQTAKSDEDKLTKKLIDKWSVRNLLNYTGFILILRNNRIKITHLS